MNSTGRRVPGITDRPTRISGSTTMRSDHTMTVGGRSSAGAGGAGSSFLLKFAPDGKTIDDYLAFLAFQAGAMAVDSAAFCINSWSRMRTTASTTSSTAPCRPFRRCPIRAISGRLHYRLHDQGTDVVDELSLAPKTVREACTRRTNKKPSRRSLELISQ